jgi:hypothetical protein
MNNLIKICSYFSCKRNIKIHTEIDELDKTVYNANLKNNDENKECCTTECCATDLFWSNSSNKQKYNRVDIAKTMLLQE